MMKDDAWFSGFADGEGCFFIMKVGGGASRRKRSLQPRFTIAVRADDVAVLEELQVAFGGLLSRTTPRGASPQARWVVVRKADLLGLAGYFDRYPLKAKKRMDYCIWREAVAVYAQTNGSDPRLVTLRDDLMATRVYDEGKSWVGQTRSA